MESEGGLRKLVEEWKGKYEEAELRGVWRLRTGNWLLEEWVMKLDK